MRKSAHSLLVIGSALLLGLGCQGKVGLPKTYPASGTVRFRDGRPLSGGLIQLQSADTSLTVSGAIEKDGTFTLQTLKGTTQVPGAPEGSYAATVVPAAGEERRIVLPAIHLSGPYRVEARDKNELSVQIDTPP